MYSAIIFALLLIAAALFAGGIYRRSPAMGVLGALLALLTGIFFWFMGFWGDMLWFYALGHEDRFWTEYIARILLGVAGAVAGLVVVSIAVFRAGRATWHAHVWPAIAGAYIGATWGAANWDTLLRFLYRVSTGVSDPILGLDAGFYLFTLPFLNILFWLLFRLGVIAVITYAVVLSMRLVEVEDGEPRLVGESEQRRVAKPLLGGLYQVIGGIFVLLAAGAWLSRYHLMYSTSGVVAGPGWTDVNLRLPAYAVAAAILALLGIAFFIGPLRQAIANRLRFWRGQPLAGEFLPLGAGVALALVVWFIAVGVIPGLFQWLRVEPNEVTLEKPYIAHNIEFTRRAYGLDDVEEREFPVSPVFNRQIVEDNQHIIGNVRLWDWRALMDVHKQFQEIRLYYEFDDVDIDRYTIGDEYRQVMASAREMHPDNLPAQSQTFVNRRFKYTHGYGITLTPVHEFTPQGLPDFLIKDIPPVSRVESLSVERPEIYYGELTNEHVVANSEEEEFDYPRGDENVYTRYEGTGGVTLSSTWRKFLYGWMFDGTRFFLSSYPTKESKLMFRRNVHERVRALAPFLIFDDDAYVVLIDGELHWIIDAYTATNRYPYSEQFGATFAAAMPGGYTSGISATADTGHLAGINYVRNSVKAVVNAYDGDVDFYVFEPDDPLIQVWQNIYPGLFLPRDDMPEPMEAHVRYPADLLLVQGLVYAKYHMTDPAVFYNQEDLWVRATEKYYGSVQPVEPYYIMWEPPEADSAEFVLMLPFTPKNRQVMIGWIAGMCDGENYGRFLAYKFPKERRVLGTQQVETKIDQDAHLSGQLTLWDQRGSNVIRGNVLAIPIGETILYVEPIYLQADTAAYPELRLVTLMHNDELSYAESFDEALRDLLGEDAAPEQALPAAPATATVESLIQDANTAFDAYIGAMSERRFDDAGKALQDLEQNLRQLTEKAGE